MIRIQCKGCKEFFGSVDRETMLCYECRIKKLESENADLHTIVHSQANWIKHQEARWSKLEEIKHEHRTIDGNRWISLGLLENRMQELEVSKPPKRKGVKT